MASLRPAILLIPGAHLPPEIYATPVDDLQSLGFDAYALPLQTVGRRQLLAPTMVDDAASIASEARKLADNGREVILVSHSYSGLPMTEATKGLAFSERAAAGLRGGIVRLVYVAAQVREVGDPIIKGDRETWPEFVKEPYISRGTPIATAHLAFPEWPEDKVQKATEYYQDQASSIYFGALSWPGYKHVPCTYVMTTNDVAAPEAKQQERIAILERYSPKVDVVEIESGHMPMLTVPEQFAQVVAEIANRG